MSVIERLDSLDKYLFKLIHYTFSWKSADFYMLLLRDALTWVPLYVFMLIWVLQFSKQYAVYFILFTLMTFAVADYCSASILKPLFSRLRPCHDAEVSLYLRDLLPCGGLYSLPSTHASNHFALTTFWVGAIKYVTGKKWFWFWLWPIAIGYAQVYVGKHYPLDILAGAIIGYLIGLIFLSAFRKQAKLPG